mgnify:FL=1
MLIARKILILFSLIIVFSCSKYSWSSEQKEKIIKDCPRPEKEICECGVDIISKNISFEDYTKIIELLKSSSIQSIELRENKKLLDKVLNIEEMIEYECGN